MTSASPYASAADRLNAFVKQDETLAAKLAYLSKRQSREAKLAFAYESGRLFALRQMKAEMVQKQSLNSYLRSHPPLAKSVEAK
jgi:Zn-dependent protease with chaperone function